jgi:hypothetical protein
MRVGQKSKLFIYCTHDLVYGLLDHLFFAITRFELEFDMFGLVRIEDLQ